MCMGREKRSSMVVVIYAHLRGMWFGKDTDEGDFHNFQVGISF